MGILDDFYDNRTEGATAAQKGIASLWLFREWGSDEESREFGDYSGRESREFGSNSNAHGVGAALRRWSGA